MNRYFYLFLILLVAGHCFGQNVVPYSLYLMNQSALNPAYIGVNNLANVTAMSRKQWLGIDGSPLTTTLMGSSTISMHSAAGLRLMSDSYGINTDTEVIANYAYHINFDDDHNLSFGLQGGFLSSTINYAKLDVDVFDDPSVGTGKQSEFTPSFGFGAMYKSDFFYLGVAVPQVTNSNLQTNGVQTRNLYQSYNVTGGFIITTVRTLKIKPSFLVSYSHDDLLVDLNGQVLIDEKIWLGASIRNFGAGGVNILFTENNMFHFGYSFQFPFNELATVGYGTHEVIISADLKLGKRHDLSGRYF
jgi:type IX secretion system PorP/SprF family membrane protein